MGTTVTDPAGVQWAVRRRWVARLGRETLWGRFHRRYRETLKKTGDVADVPDVGCAPDFGEAIVVFILAIAAIAFLFLVAIPLAFAVFDLLFLLLLGAVGLAARILLRRPWTVEAIEVDGDATLHWRVVGWRASNERCEQIAQSLGAGVVPPADPTA